VLSQPDLVIDVIRKAAAAVAAKQGQAYLLCPVISDVDLFRYCEGIIYLDPEIPDGAFDLGVAEQELHGS
jgi:hypothetical protein